jgi:hypothetical protein
MNKLFFNSAICALLISVPQVSWGGSDKPEKQTDATAILAEDFDDFFRSSFASALHHNDNASIIFNEGIEKSKALIVYYQGDERGSERVIETTPLEQPLAQADLRFDVKFCEGFDFARGGKLHGFAPRNPVTGGRPIKPEGWSARAMWGKNGSLKSYIYHQQMKGKYGDVKVAKDFNFESGRYYHMRYHITLNQPANRANGVFKIYVDDQLVVNHTDLQFRGIDDPKTLVHKFLFNTFHGGSDPSWAPRTADGGFKRDCAYFDNISVSTP